MKNSDLAKLQALYTAQALPHAWLFICTDLEIGLQTAQTFTQWLLCTNKSNSNACGICKACKLFTNAVHPDYCLVTPQEDKQSIAIDDVRTSIDFATSKPQISATKVILLYPAQAMHTQSANALLKALEEPYSDTIYILIASHKDLLPKTIISRCHILSIENTSPFNDAVKTNVQAMYTDLQALWLHKTATSHQTAELWNKRDPHEVLYCFELLLTDMLRYKNIATTRFARVWCEDQEKLSNVLPDHKLWTILEQLRQAQYLLGHNYKPNMQLLLENMLLV